MRIFIFIDCLNLTHWRHDKNSLNLLFTRYQKGILGVSIFGLGVGHVVQFPDSVSEIVVWIEHFAELSKLPSALAITLTCF